MSKGPKTYSTIIEQIHNPYGPRKLYDREQIYRWLWDNSDSRGFIVYPKREVAERLEIERKMMYNIFNEFVYTGHLKVHGSGRNQKFECMWHPDLCDWSDRYYEVLVTLFKHRESRKSAARKKEEGN